MYIMVFSFFGILQTSQPTSDPRQLANLKKQKGKQKEKQKQKQKQPQHTTHTHSTTNQHAKKIKSKSPHFTSHPIYIVAPIGNACSSSLSNR